MNNKLIGDLGEKLVVKYLNEKNYQIIKTNFVCKQGEIDIIAVEEKEIVFIEVKTRLNKKYGNPIESVNLHKQKHIENAAKYFVFKNNLQNNYIRFDIVEVYFKNKNYFLNHIKNVFW